MKEFCDTYNLKNLILELTCFKNVQNPTIIDMILTNKANCFQNSSCIETGISDHHNMSVTVLQVHFKKLKPIKIKPRNYKKFNINNFSDELKISLNSSDQTNINYDKFKDIIMNILNEHAPVKEKLYGNNAPFINKTLSKAFMHRAKSKNNYNKNPTGENFFNTKKKEIIA